MSPREIKKYIIIISLLCVTIIIVAIKAPKPKPKSKINAVPVEQFVTNNLLANPDVFVAQDDKKYIVNTEIIQSDDSDYDYMNTSNNFQTYFPLTANKSKDIKFQKDDAWVNFNVVSLLTIKKNDANNKETIIAQKTIDELKPSTGKINLDENSKNKFFYPKIYQNEDKFIDIVYTIYDDKLSEEIILNKYQDFPELTQHLSLHNTHIKVEGQKINFLDKKTGKILWYITPPKMYEQAKQFQINSGLVYDIRCDNPKTALEKCQEFTLTKKFTDDGKQWLADPKRQYPVVIDPNFQIDSADTVANWVSSDSTNFAASQETYIKYEGTGSVKVIAIPKCWQLGGSCNSACQYNSLGNTVTGYSSCSSSSCGGNCWGTGGSCDSECRFTGYFATTYKNSCGSATACDGNCWGISGSCDSGCTAGSVGSQTLYTNCSSGTYCP